MKRRNLVNPRNRTLLLSYQNLTRSPLNVITAKKWTRDCYKKKNDLKKKESYAKLANGDENSMNKPGEIALIFSSQSKGADWWIDSVASQHMIPEKKFFEDYSTFETPLKVKLADDRELYEYGRRNVHLTVMTANNKINIVLKDVHFVPKLQNKLFSLQSITKKGVAVEFKDKSSGNTINESSTPSAIRSASFTN